MDTDDVEGFEVTVVTNQTGRSSRVAGWMLRMAAVDETSNRKMTTTTTEVKAVVVCVAEVPLMQVTGLSTGHGERAIGQSVSSENWGEKMSLRSNV